MKSMTGYGLGRMSDDKYCVTVELSSVNRKSLDVSVSLAKEWAGLERAVADGVRNVISRGSVRVVVDIAKREKTEEIDIDVPLVHRMLDKLGDIARSRGIRSQMDYETLLRVVLLNREDSTLSRKQDVESMSVLVKVSLDQAVSAFVAMRGKEGSALETDLLERNEKLLDLVFTIRTRSKGTVEAYRDVLLARLKQLGLTLDLGDERLLKELAFYADRIDTAEELTRLESHLSQFRATVITARTIDEPVGRKLEFLIQEINREFNTIGSKANNVEVTRAVLDAKNDVERQREQVQNVEGLPPTSGSE
jgi:uncharacterized protein (TIGR00255 family)